MIFLCEHETQGLAYQEALACNVPVLAWDNGYWLDPLWRRLSPDAVPASSVPYFSEQCGERFRDICEFTTALERFLKRLPTLEPREYVVTHLSMVESARIYANAYFSLLEMRQCECETGAGMRPWPAAPLLSGQHLHSL